MKKFLFTTLAVGALAVSAGAEEVVIPKNSDGCFEISTAEQLLGFAQHINNNIDQHDDDHDHKNDCALLMNDIKFNGDTKVVKDDLTGVNSSSFKSWEPLREFAGTFDGQGHTISGLYYVAPETTEDGKKGRRDAGFFAHLSGHAKVVNVRVEDSYFAADERAGGIAADIKSGSEVYIDQVSFKGIVSSYTTNCSVSWTNLTLTRVNGYIGGLIGTVSQGAKIINLSNSFNEGTVTTGKCGVWDDNNPKMGGLIGVIQDVTDDGAVNITNCYNAGEVKTSKRTLTGIGDEEGPSIIGKLEGDKSSSTAEKIHAENVGCTKAQSTYCETASNASALNDAYEEYIDAQIQETLNNPPEGTPKAKGVTIASSSGKRIATIHENDGEVIIPQDIVVDEVVYARSFTTNRSTITLPFSISVANVVDANGQPVTFSKLNAMEVTDENKWEISKTDLAVGAVEAHTPYLVQTSVAGSLTFKGSVTLKATTDGAAKISVVPYDASEWQFNGVYTTKVWENDLADCDECGRAYVFKDGAFKKVGSKVRVSVYRAYLLAPEEYKVVVAAKAAAGVSLDNENPDEITIRDVGTDENDHQKYKVSFNVVEVVESVNSENDESLAIAKPIMTTEPAKSNRWFDLKGRRLNSKPTAHGTYFNNKTPVIVK